MEGYDIIGDIHGHYQELVLLLEQLGYKQGAGSRDHYFHPESRKVLFVGDYIDRGSENLRVLALVKKMTDAGTALALMGNHEYNCLAWHTPKNQAVFKNEAKSDNFLRTHTEHNREQTHHTLAEFEKYPAQKDFFLKWMKTLPLFLELNQFRVVHACWDNNQIQYLKTGLPSRNYQGFYGTCLTEDFFQKSWKVNTSPYNAMETILKGKELPLPAGTVLKGTDGLKRPEFRVKWWISSEKILKARDLNEVGIFGEGQAEKLTDMDWFEREKKKLADLEIYSNHEKPLFIGHYWLQGKPELLSGNIACVDYSVANNGKLAAYRWSGEKELRTNSFCWIEKLGK